MPDEQFTPELAATTAGVPSAARSHAGTPAAASSENPSTAATHSGDTDAKSWALMWPYQSCWASETAMTSCATPSPNSTRSGTMTATSHSVFLIAVQVASSLKKYR